MGHQVDVAQEVLLWITFICRLFIIFPILIYYLREYRSKQHHIVFQMRYSKITVIQTILLLIELIVELTPDIIIEYSDLGHDSTLYHFYITIDAFVAGFFLYSFVWKLWLLRFNIMVNRILISSQWRTVITQKERDKSKSFYIRYKRTLGNIWVSGAIIFTVACTFCSMYVAAEIKYPHNDRNILKFEWDYIVPYVLLVPIYVTTPKMEVYINLSLTIDTLSSCMLIVCN